MYTGCAKRTIGQGRAGAASWASCLLSKSCQEARSEAEMRIELALTYELPPYRSSSTITFHAHPVFLARLRFTNRFETCKRGRERTVKGAGAGKSSVTD